MSEIESYIGKLVPVPMEDKTIEEISKELCDRKDLPAYSLSWLEQLQEEKSENYYYNETLDQLFRVEKESFDPEQLTLCRKNDDGTFDFIVSFYNGGAYIDEVLDSGIKKTEET